MSPRAVSQSSEGSDVSWFAVNAGIGVTSFVDADAVENPTTAAIAAIVGVVVTVVLVIVVYFI